jgi:hypothetical protein
MKFTVAKEHRDYFNTHGIIEFEDLLSQEKIDKANNEIDRILKDRTKGSPQTPLSYFNKGRDLWRSSSFLRNIDCNNAFADIIKEFFIVPVLRLGYDQLLPTIPGELLIKQDVYSKWTLSNQTLQESSCIQGVICGLVLCLEDNQKDNTGVLSNKAGSGVFVKPDVALNFSGLNSNEAHRYLLITYCDHNSVYIQQKGDPQFHLLREIGYAYGDKLKDKTHPLIGK